MKIALEKNKKPNFSYYSINCREDTLRFIFTLSYINFEINKVYFQLKKGYSMRRRIQIYRL